MRRDGAARPAPRTPLVTDDWPAGLAGLVRRTFGCEPIGAARVRGGANSRVLKVRLAPGGAVAAKLYPREAPGARDRIGAEFEGLRFLWSHGMRCIPEPLAMDRARRLALYGFIEGRRVRPSDTDAACALAAARLLRELRTLGELPAARRLPPAAEACFSLEETIELLGVRLARLLDGATGSGGTERAARRFLEQRFSPALSSVAATVRAGASAAGISLRRPLAAGLQVLSPSDCGFHNTLRRRDGSLVFLDFEYFGWDDPAKAAADFCLHPRGPVPPGLRRLFLRELARGLPGDEKFAARLRLLYPLLSLKWCLIMLNVFLPAAMLRRRHATGEKDEDALKTRQLRKAARRLCRAVREFDSPEYPPLARW